MKKRIFIIIGLALTIFIGISAYNANIINPNNVTIREEELVSNKIDKSFNGFVIAYFADLHFSNTSNEDLVNQLVNNINNSGADVILFGGDLINQLSTNVLTETKRTFLIDKLNELKAPYGKFAVLGDYDEETAQTINYVSDILKTSNFTIITNKNIKIYNDTNNYLNLIGIDSSVNGTPDINKAYEDIDDTHYSFVLTHCPDVFTRIDYSKTDYCLSGHSHGGQIYIPLINYLYRFDGCEKYFKGKYNKYGTTLDITNGVGTKDSDARFLADSEIVLYKLISK